MNIFKVGNGLIGPNKPWGIRCVQFDFLYDPTFFKRWGRVFRMRLFGFRLLFVLNKRGSGESHEQRRKQG